MVKLNKKETACIAYHLMIQQRQTVLKKNASIIEACKKCNYFEQCKDNHFKQWAKVCKRLCKSVGIKGFFCITSSPRECYEKEDIY